MTLSPTRTWASPSPHEVVDEVPSRLSSPKDGKKDNLNVQPFTIHSSTGERIGIRKELDLNDSGNMGMQEKGGSNSTSLDDDVGIQRTLMAVEEKDTSDNGSEKSG